jgi:uncharacterized protein YjbJ (UPF0337 family)
MPERTRTTTTAGEDTGTVKQAAGTATEEAGRVAGVAKGQAQEVASEIGTQARDLVGELRTQVHDQSISQRDRLAGNLRRFGDDLDHMRQSATGSGLATDLTGMLATRAREVSTFLGEHEPGDLIEELRRFARRRPGLFLLGAAVAGVVAGRLTRGAASSDSMSSNGSAGRHRGTAEWSTPPPSASRPMQGTTIDDAVVGGSGVTAGSLADDPARTASRRPGRVASSASSSAGLRPDEPLLEDEVRRP